MAQGRKRDCLLLLVLVLLGNASGFAVLTQRPAEFEKTSIVSASGDHGAIASGVQQFGSGATGTGSSSNLNTLYTGSGLFGGTSSSDRFNSDVQIVSSGPLSIVPIGYSSSHESGVNVQGSSTQYAASSGQNIPAQNAPSLQLQSSSQAQSLGPNYAYSKRKCVKPQGTLNQLVSAYQSTSSGSPASQQGTSPSIPTQRLPTRVAGFQPQLSKPLVSSQSLSSQSSYGAQSARDSMWYSQGQSIQLSGQPSQHSPVVHVHPSNVPVADASWSSGNLHVATSLDQAGYGAQSTGLSSASGQPSASLLSHAQSVPAFLTQTTDQSLTSSASRESAQVSRAQGGYMAQSSGASLGYNSPQDQHIPSPTRTQASFGVESVGHAIWYKINPPLFQTWQSSEPMFSRAAVSAPSAGFNAALISQGAGTGITSAAGPSASVSQNIQPLPVQRTPVAASSPQRIASVIASQGSPSAAVSAPYSGTFAALPSQGAGTRTTSAAGPSASVSQPSRSTQTLTAQRSPVVSSSGQTSPGHISSAVTSQGSSSAAVSAPYSGTFAALPPQGASYSVSQPSAPLVGFNFPSSISTAVKRTQRLVPSFQQVR